jgi:hypothetical protein
MDERTLAGLGAPDLTFAGFQLWVHGYAYADAAEGGDADWLRVTAHAGASGASVWVSGTMLETSDVLRFRGQLAAMHASLTGEAALESYEPNVVVRAAMRSRAGQVDLRVELTPDHLAQGHWFEFDADQSYLPAVLTQCDALLARVPVRDPARRGV